MSSERFTANCSFFIGIIYFYKNKAQHSLNKNSKIFDIEKTCHSILYNRIFFYFLGVFYPDAYNPNKQAYILKFF